MTWGLDQTANTTLGKVKWGTAGQGPALILAHGWPWSSFAWSRVIEDLAHDFHVFWYDMPGFGQSDAALDHPTDLGAQAGVLAEMISHWGLEAPAIWAHDFGGAISLRARLLDGLELGPQLFMNVVAMRPWGSDFFTHVGEHVDAFYGLPPHIHEAVVRAYIQGALVRDIATNDIEMLVAPWLGDNGQRAFYRQFAQADEALTSAFEPKLATFPGPCHVIWGADDPWIPLARGEALATALGAGFEEMPSLGHLPQLENPKAVLTVAQSFFERVI